MYSYTVDCCNYQYFYVRLRNDVNGNPRYKVYVLDPDGPAAYEKTLCSYDIHTDVQSLINGMVAQQCQL